MSDAYGEVLTNITAKTNKNLNGLMLRYEKIKFLREKDSPEQNLIWVDYVNENN